MTYKRKTKVEFISEITFRQQKLDEYISAIKKYFKHFKFFSLPGRRLKISSRLLFDSHLIVKITSIG